MRWGLLAAALLLFLSASGGSARAEPPCGPWHDLCVAALTDAGVEPDHWMPPLYGVQWIVAFGNVLWCESRYDPTAVGEIDSGDRGLWQINARWWPNVSDAQAFDPVFATHWAARQWVDGRAWLWSCWHELYRVAPGAGAGPVPDAVPNWLACFRGRVLTSSSQRLPES